MSNCSFKCRLVLQLTFMFLLSLILQIYCHDILQIASFVQPTVKIPSALRLLTYITKNSCRSLHLRRWDQQMFDICRKNHWDFQIKISVLTFIINYIPTEITVRVFGLLMQRRHFLLSLPGKDPAVCCHV